MKTGCLILGFVLTGDADAGQILGNAIAHEIGHLLLNNQSHSASGIMRGDWNLWDLRNASYGYLLFTPQQAKAIQTRGTQAMVVLGRLYNWVVTHLCVPLNRRARLVRCSTHLGLGACR
jgi:hypothetical protein